MRRATVPWSAQRPRPSLWRRLSIALGSPTRRALGALALVATLALWGTSFVATKPVLAHAPPLTLALARFVVALAVLLPLTLGSGRRPVLGRGAAGLGLVGMSLFFVCQNLGLRGASATNAALILNGGIPVLTTLFAALLLREPCAGRRLAGTLVSLAGVGALVLVGAAGALAFSGLGDALLLAAAACGAAYTLLGRRCFGGGDALALTTGSMLYGALFLLPTAGLELALGPAPRPSAGDALLVLYLGVGCSALPFLLWGYALARLEACEVAVLGNLELLFGVVFAALLLREAPTAAQVGGGALILLGAWLAIRPELAAETAAPSPKRGMPGGARSSPEIPGMGDAAGRRRRYLGRSGT